MIDPNDTNIDNIGNINEALRDQIGKFNGLRETVKKLQFVPIDPVGDYQAVTYKAIDGGKMNITFDPLEIDLIEVADSYGNLKMRFLLPKPDEDTDIGDSLKYFDNEPTIAKFLNLLNQKSLRDISEILTDPGTYMEISEWACLFEKIMDQKEEPLVIMRDGLLRTKKLKSELIPILIDALKAKRKYAKLVGVSKVSKILTLLSSAIFIDHIIPPDKIGYIKIPKELEADTYTWTGKGHISKTNKRIYYAFGDLYIAKLSKESNLLVTVEIPSDLENNEDVYDKNDINRIMGHLAKDAAHSYPVIGYPQTIMRAHEAAARVGFPASIIRDKIIERMTTSMGDDVKEFRMNSYMLKEFVNKGVLGGGHGE